ncbi:MAG: PilZ domain-containing protein [Deltaproteobacteria bacterium]|nr:PilZ domain-containing protein [Deltaproteobacteria bacterium]
MSPTNARKAERHDICLPIEVSMEGATLSGKTRNLSLGGAFIDGGRPVAFGTRVVLRFKVSPQGELIEVGGTVRWNDGSGFGVQFDGLHARDVYALNKLFEKPGD